MGQLKVYHFMCNRTLGPYVFTESLDFLNNGKGESEISTITVTLFVVDKPESVQDNNKTR